MDNSDVYIQIGSPDFGSGPIVGILVKFVYTTAVSSLFVMDERDDDFGSYISAFIDGEYKSVYHSETPWLFTENCSKIIEEETSRSALNTVIQMYRDGKLKIRYDFQKMFEMCEDDELDLKKREDLFLREFRNLNKLNSDGKLILNEALKNKQRNRLLSILFTFEKGAPDPKLKVSEKTAPFGRSGQKQAGFGFYFCSSRSASFQRFALECIPGRFASALHRCMAETRTKPNRLFPNLHGNADAA